ncbi:glycosyltransferase family 4 protein [Flavihumibacter rivuli]|uniref:glycosyltransferase family 4 protein n=1 Tax=Flavihumibacter rivuli TaxID=2838156 RepID=UPI001BDDDCC6|nr:glycosyltransferase family 4 protein [Flavihumibacter rivuli]ULQ57425.1 glycosyltransferase family 4 protein [Flavihumibacter rivuli]
MLEGLFIFPFVWWGKWQARKRPLGEEYELFFLFPFYAIGGAEKVHLDIARCFRGRKAVIFFTRHSKDQGYLEAFRETGHRLIEISTKTDNKWQYWNNLVYRGIIAGYIQQQQKSPVVFNGQCNFAYKLSPWLGKDIAQIELIHSLCSFSYIRLPFIEFYRQTIMISRKSIDQHLAIYRKYGVPVEWDSRIRLIQNGIPLPEQVSERAFDGQLKLLYVGRGTKEKRVHLVAAIAANCIREGLPVSLSLMGEVKGAIPQELHAFCHFVGNQSDPAIIDQVYRSADLLLITSSSEGFPLVVMEAMARGLSIIGTAVGDIPLHVRDGVNGYILNQVEDENALVEEACKFIRLILSDPPLLRQQSANNIQYAKHNFDIRQFETNYRDLLEPYL